MDKYDWDSDDSKADPNFSIDKNYIESEENDTPKASKCKSRGQQTSQHNSDMIVKNVSPGFGVEKQTPTRKKKRRVDTWQRNVRKRLLECGEEYTDQKGKIHRKRSISGSTCLSNCTFNCQEMFSKEDMQKIHENFWKLDDKSKNHFYSKFVEKVEAKRKKQDVKKARLNSFKYYFTHNENVVRVCQKFFLKTLDVSENRIYYFFKKKKKI